MKIVGCNSVQRIRSRYQIKLPTLILLAIIITFFCIAGGQAEIGKTFFWIGTDHSQIFDQKIVEFIGDHAWALIINAPYNPHKVDYSYAKIVERFHELTPETPILMYTWISRWHDTQRIGTNILAGYLNQPLLDPDAKRWRDKLKKLAQSIGLKTPKLLFGDVTSSSYREWVVQRIKLFQQELNTNGIALDGVFRVLPRLVERRGKKFAKQYANGMDSLFKELRNQLPGQLIIYNGLDVWDPGRKTLDHNAMEDQELLLNNSDGIMIEWFGLVPWLNIIPSFKDGILNYIRIIGQYPDKHFIVSGRAPWHYTRFEQDYFWQRYLYCAYLLAANSRTHFRYNASFQYPAHAGRTGGLSYFADWDIDLGEPLEPFMIKNGVYLRRFTKGLVLLVPHDDMLRYFQLKNVMQTPEGIKITGRVGIRPGEGYLLLGKISQKNSITSHQKSGDTTSSIKLISKYNKISSKSSFKYIMNTNGDPDDPVWKNDLLLEPVRMLDPKGSISFRLKTKDPNANIRLRCEVDDPKGINPYVVLKLSTKESSEGLKSEQHDIPYRTSSNKPIPYIMHKGILVTDNKWHKYNLNLISLLKRQGNYDLWRVCNARFTGDLEIANIKLHKDR